MLRDYRAHAFSQAVFGVLIDADVPLPAAALVVRPRRRGIYFGANNSPYMWRENKSSASDRFGPVHFRSTHARTRRHLRSGCICGCREANTWWTPPRVRIRKGSSLIAVISLQRQDLVPAEPQLGKVGDAAAVEALKKTLSDDRDVRRAAAEALTKILDS